MKKPTLVTSAQAAASARLKWGSGDPEGKHCEKCGKKLAVPTKHRTCKRCRAAKRGAKK